MFKPFQRYSYFDANSGLPCSRSRVRQEDHIRTHRFGELHPAPQLMQAQGSGADQQYAEGYSGKALITADCEFVDIADSWLLTAPRALFGADLRQTCRPHRWSQANSAVFKRCLSPGDYCLRHWSLGARRSPDPMAASVNFSGKHYNAVQYGIQLNDTV